MAENGTSEKAVDLEAVSKSVQDFPDSPRLPTLQSSVFWMLGQSQDEITPWGKDAKRRDLELREFAVSEPTFLSALGIVCSRNASFRWSIEGEDSLVSKYHRILEDSNFGLGWSDLIMKVSVDLYTQDSGAFIEVIRTDNDPGAEVLALNHLDSARCYHTGNREAPVIYQDRKGQYHVLRWWQVITLAEMPVGIEGYYGMQYCALTRLMRSAQIAKNIATYDYERTGGRHTRAIHLIKGITSSQVQDAIDEMNIRLSARGAQRYSQPLIVGSVDPKADVGHDTLELASLPDNFDREHHLKWYNTQLSMAFLEDYQTFAPLPGGNLGSSSQSEVLHANARGKGPGLFRALMTHAFNFMVLPDSLRFQFDEQDLAQEETEAKVKKMRAEERSIRILSQELSPEAARQLAVDTGDLPQVLFESLGGNDLTPNLTLQDQATPESQAGGASEGLSQNR